MAVAKNWILESPHTSLKADDLADLSKEGERRIEKENEKVHVALAISGESQWTALRLVQITPEIEWTTTVVLSRESGDAWVGIRTSREATKPALKLPPARKPIIVRKLLERFGGASDGGMIVSDQPHRLNNNDIPLAARLMTGRANCYLPVVYLSADFRGGTPLDADGLAHDLSGLAHVVVEPNRPFSRRLQIEVKSENVYGGTIGVYWPGGAGRRSFFIGQQFENPQEIKKAVVDDIKTALVHRRPLYRCTFPAVQEVISRLKIEDLKVSGSKELHEYMDAFDAENKAKEERLRDAEAEIARLEAEMRRYEADAGSGPQVVLRLGDEQDLYPGEMSEIIRDELSAAVDRAQNDSRREHVLKAILAATPPDNNARGKREELKEILRGYKNMDKKTQAGLEELGFSIEGDGKHYKLTFREDDRYTFSLPKTGSDYRGGLNAASDISKRLF